MLLERPLPAAFPFPRVLLAVLCSTFFTTFALGDSVVARAAVNEAVHAADSAPAASPGPIFAARVSKDAGQAAASAPVRKPGPALTARASNDKGQAARAPGLLARYLTIDTTNPGQGERDAAEFLAALLRSEGIETRIFEAEEGRASLYARLPGSGKKGAVVLLSHMDVVPADEARWEHPPLAAELDDGFLYGRGALDCKGPGIIQALAMMEIKRSGAARDRDIILLASADEEAGGALGVGWMIENHFDLFADADLVLNEGGLIHR